MAGLGYKVWSAGDVLAAADVNGYLMNQAVMVFDDSGARGSAIGTATEGMMSYLKDTNLVEVYDGASWSGIDTTVSSLNGTAINYTLTASTAVAYEFASTDNGKILQFTGGTTTLTLGTATAMSAGGRIEIINDTPEMTITAGTGVTIGAAGTAGTALSFTVAPQYGGVGIIALGSDAYRIIGNVSVV